MATDPSPNELPKTGRPFAARMLRGEVGADQVDRSVRSYLIDKEARRKGVTLARWLGLTDEAYGAWVADGSDDDEAEAKEAST